MWGKQKPHTDMYEVLTDSTNNFCASRRYVLISICFRFTIALRMEPCFFYFLNEMIDNKKSCKRWCLQDFSSSPSWARTNNPTVNSRVLYHWAIEDYSVFLHFFFGVRPCRCSTIELSRITSSFSLQIYSMLSFAFIYLQNYILNYLFHILVFS